MNPRIEFWCGGEEAARAATTLLAGRGLHVVRSFDLRAAQAAGDACGCPHHGTADCTCSYAVLLVYGESGPPAVVTAHSRDARTHFEIVLDPNAMPPKALVGRVVDALLAPEPSPPTGRLPRRSLATPPMTSVGLITTDGTR